MVDIAKCNRKDCAKKLTCFRYLADSDEFRQSYVNIDKVDVSNGCDMYWLVRNKKELAYYNKVNR